MGNGYLKDLVGELIKLMVIYWILLNINLLMDLYIFNYYLNYVIFLEDWLIYKILIISFLDGVILGILIYNKKILIGLKN